MTAKGTRPGSTPLPKASPDEVQVTRAASASSRYTPPSQARQFEESKPWIPYLMFALWILGGLVIILNYLSVLLPGAVNNWYLVIGLGLILAGLMVATQYR